MTILRLIPIAILLLDWAAVADEVSITPKEITAGKDRVEASGRWEETTRLNSKAPFLPRLNSVEIVCNRAQGTCHEAVAALFTKDDVPQLSKQWLTALFSEYKVTRWDASGITAKSAKAVADDEIKIDLRARTAIRRHTETKARGSETADPNLVIVWELR